MGAEGSGRYTITSKAFDLADFSEDLIRYLDRYLHHDPTRPMTFEILDTFREQLENHKTKLKKALEKNTNEDNA